MKNDIEVTRGRTANPKVRVTVDGEAYALKSGEKLVFGVKKRAHHEELLIKKVVTTGTDGVYEIPIAPEDTIDLPFGNYIYDVGLLIGSEYHDIIKESTFTIGKNVTKSGDAT